MALPSERIGADRVRDVGELACAGDRRDLVLYVGELAAWTSSRRGRARGVDELAVWTSSRRGRVRGVDEFAAWTARGGALPPGLYAAN